jgi:hypothetical protein
LLHDFESWFTEAGANCNAEGGHFRDSVFIGACSTNWENSTRKGHNGFAQGCLQGPMAAIDYSRE